jgi:hypothetical protein
VERREWNAVKHNLTTGHEGLDVEYRYCSTLFLASAIIGGQRHAPAALPPGGRGAYCIGDCVGPRAGINGKGKSHATLEFYARTVQLVASRYTD